MPQCLEIRKKVSQLIFGIKNQVENSNKNKNGLHLFLARKLLLIHFEDNENTVERPKRRKLKNVFKFQTVKTFTNSLAFF